MAVVGGVYSCQSRWSETVQFHGASGQVETKNRDSVVRKQICVVLKDTVETFHMGS